MKKNFLTGLAILFPIVLTYIILSFFINLLTKPFVGYLENLLAYHTPTAESAFSVEFHKYALILSKLLILLGLAGTFILVGILGRLFLINTIFRHVDLLALRIPGINHIYKTIQETVQTVFMTNGTKFSSVVLVPFPHAKSYCMAFITNESVPDASGTDLEEIVSAFVPGTPNPTMGFMLLFKRKDVIYVDMAVEDALKFIVSCGVISKDFTSKTKSDITTH
ncbi:MAG: DUF502 domain-containing protein [Parachlamydiaceae bacterium]|nr:DUF502 domain-containing protein [Parachlamydiaceae bacterium]